MYQLNENQVETVNGGALPAVAIVVVQSTAVQAGLAAAAGFIGAAIEWALSGKKSS